jgi:hypothetical protein
VMETDAAEKRSVRATDDHQDEGATRSPVLDGLAEELTTVLGSVRLRHVERPTSHGPFREVPHDGSDVLRGRQHEVDPPPSQGESKSGEVALGSDGAKGHSVTDVGAARPPSGS